MQKLVPLNKIKSNPFRLMGEYPLREETLAELAQSIEETGFWENILAREKNGHVELAYGHHRLEVLRRKYRKTPSRKVPLNFAKLSNENMLKIMVRENREEYGGSARQNMSDVEVAVIKGRFAFGATGKRRTLVEMGRVLGLTKERVRQIQKKAVRRLREALEAKLTGN